MIHTTEKTFIAIFGSGTICVARSEENGTMFPVVTLSNCEPQEIGEDVLTKEENSPSIKLTFTDEKSLDVFIASLERSRQSFRNREERENYCGAV